MTAVSARPGLLVAALLACRPAVAPAPPPAPAPAPEPAGLTGPVVAIELTGTARQLDARAVLVTAVGATYDPDTLARDVRALWRLGGVDDVRVDARPVPGGVALRYRVTELPRVRRLDLRGGPPVLTALWKMRTAEIRDVPQDPAAIQRLVAELRDDLVARAYLDAAVTWRTAPTDDGRVDVVLDIDAGPRVTVGALDLRGHRRLAAGELAQILRAHGLAVGQPFVRAARDEALLAAVARYRDLGHVDAELRPLPEVRSPDGDTVALAVEVREGDAFRLGKLTVKGALVAPVRDYERRLGVRPGQTFAASKLAAGLDEIRALHRERGAGEPGIVTVPVLDAAARTIDLTLEISPP
jgi:outer membrane protein insertion porin family